MGAVKGASGGEMGQDMITRHIARMAAVIVVLLAVSSARAEFIYVDVANCPGPGSGTVRDPYCAIQTAIDAAVDDDEVVVADGTYTGAGNRDIDFDGRLITVRSASGDPSTCIIDCQANSDDLHRGFYLHSGETNDAVIDGFTVMNGYAPGVADNKLGGGILCEGSSPTITNCIFRNNTASRGGGIMLLSTTNPVIDGCVVFENEGVFGTGGIRAWGGTANLTITNTTISGNTAIQGAGGIYCQDVVLTITNCIVSANVELPGVGSGVGGIIVSGRSSATITGCTITENTGADGVAGGLQYTANGPLVMDNCTISGNSSPFRGGGVYWSSAEPGSITNCLISNNTAAESGGGIALFDSSPIWLSPILANCTITGNSAGQDGGGLLCATGTPAVVNCTISDNTAGSRGGGIACLASAATLVTIANTILWNDDAPNGSEIALTQEGNNPAGLIVDYGDVQGGQEDAHVEGGSALFWGDGNIDADPLFVAPGIDDYRLSSGSPCIDAGDNTAVLKGTTTGLDGNPRFVDDPDTIDSGNGDPPIVDMGAYEFQGASPCPWDCGGDKNGDVGITDFLALLAQWGGPGSCDFDGGGVGINDFLELLANWGPCP